MKFKSTIFYKILKSLKITDIVLFFLNRINDTNRYATKLIIPIKYYILKIYEMSLGRFLYLCAKKYAHLHTQLMHNIEWDLSNKTPSNYKHEINLYNWMYNPAKCEFVEGGGIRKNVY